MKDLEQLIENIKTIAEASKESAGESASAPAKISAIIYEMAQGDTAKYYLILSIFTDRFKMN